MHEGGAVDSDDFVLWELVVLALAPHVVGKIIKVSEDFEASKSNLESVELLQELAKGSLSSSLLLRLLLLLLFGFFRRFLRLFRRLLFRVASRAILSLLQH